jgi:hypothetical protein
VSVFARQSQAFSRQPQGLTPFAQVEQGPRLEVQAGHIQEGVSGLDGDMHPFIGRTAGFPPLGAVGVKECARHDVPTVKWRVARLFSRNAGRHAVREVFVSPPSQAEASAGAVAASLYVQPLIGQAAAQFHGGFGGCQAALVVRPKKHATKLEQSLHFPIDLARFGRAGLGRPESRRFLRLQVALMGPNTAKFAAVDDNQNILIIWTLPAH